MRITLRMYYRRVHLTGFEHVPKSGPVIFACNHPNSFLDAMMVGAYITRPVHFLTRSDVFNTPLKLWLLSQFKMIPIYRLQEGAENLDKNKETFERCHKIFREGGAVLVFSEGLCIQEPRLRPLKKGTARIALEYSKDGAPLAIIPTGLNYLKPTEFRESMMMGMDMPFNAADFAAEYVENNGKGIQAFNRKLDAGLHRQVIDIRERDPEKEKATLQFVEIHYNNTNGKIARLVTLIDDVNELAKTKADLYNEWMAKLTDYSARLKKYGLKDETISGNIQPNPSLFFARALMMVGHLLFYLPTQYSRRIAKTKVRRVEFFDSVLIGALCVLDFFYLLILFGLLCIYSPIVAASIVLAMYVMGEIAIICHDVIVQQTQARLLRAIGNEEFVRLKKLRDEIGKLPASVFDLV